MNTPAFEKSWFGIRIGKFDPLRKRFLCLFHQWAVLAIDLNPRFLTFPAQVAANKAAFIIMETAYAMISFFVVIFELFICGNGFKMTDE